MSELEGKIKQQDIDMGEEDEIEISLLLCAYFAVYFERVWCLGGAPYCDVARCTHTYSAS